MILDYITPNGNYDGLFSSGGLRIYHVDATLANDEYGAPYLTADNYSPVYDSTNNGRRILRLVNNRKAESVDIAIAVRIIIGIVDRII